MYERLVIVKPPTNAELRQLSLDSLKAGVPLAILVKTALQDIPRPVEREITVDIRRALFDDGQMTTIEGRTSPERDSIIIDLGDDDSQAEASLINLQ